MTHYQTKPDTQLKHDTRLRSFLMVLKAQKLEVTFYRAENLPRIKGLVQRNKETGGWKIVEDHAKGRVQPFLESEILAFDTDLLGLMISASEDDLE